MTSPLPQLTALARRLGELHARARTGPLPPDGLRAVERVARELADLEPALAAYQAELERTRGLDLEAARAGAADGARLARDAALLVITTRRAAGHIRGAAEAYWALVRRAPRDHRWRDLLAGFGHLLEEYGELRGAGRTRTLTTTLLDGWWRDPIMVQVVEEALRAIEPRLATLPIQV